jgi:LacI family transcriptional regulator
MAICQVVRGTDNFQQVATNRVTLADVARAAGVSKTAASFVLSGRGAEMRISPEAEARVRRAAKETGYRPNILSRSLRTGTSRTIGFVSDTVATTPFAGHLIWGALDAARDRDHLLIIGETEGDPDLEQQMVEAMHDRGVDGIVFASMYTRELELPPGLTSGPAVLLNAVPQGAEQIPCIVPDEFEAGRAAVATLIQAGHRDRIALVGAAPPDQSPVGSLAAVQRLDGILQALGEAGVGAFDAVPCPDWQPDYGFQAVNQLLERRERPTALICFNDRLALGAYQAIAEQGLSLPDDVSVVSFDDDVLATWLRPQLTTIALPHYELGRAAIDALVDTLQPSAGAPSLPQIRRIAMPVRERGSVRQPASAAPV